MMFGLTPNLCSRILRLFSNGSMGKSFVVRVMYELIILEPFDQCSERCALYAYMAYAIDLASRLCRPLRPMARDKLDDLRARFVADIPP